MRLDRTDDPHSLLEDDEAADSTDRLLRFVSVSSAGRLAALAEIFLVSGIATDFLALVLLSACTGFPVGQITRHSWTLFLLMMISTSLIIALAVLMQRLSTGHADLKIRIRPPKGFAVETGICLLLLPGLFVLTVALRWAVESVFPSTALPVNPILALLQTPGDLALFLISGVVAGGLREEVQRAFIIVRGKGVFRAPLTVLAIWSVVFGLSHHVQGWSAVIVTAVLGFCLGLIYIWRENLYASFLSHSLYNVAVLLLAWTAAKS